MESPVPVQLQPAPAFGLQACRIRPATADDIPRLAALRYEFRTALAPAVEQHDDFTARAEKWMRDRLGAGSWFCWLAHDREGICGTVWIQLVEKIPTPTDEPEMNAYLTNFFVVERARARGVGSELLRCVLTWCRERGVHIVYLWPTVRTRALYERHGFRADGDTMQLLFAPRAQ